ncbi:leucine-rich repeat-containing protein 63 [Nannospalax galili]|uniref:leucine-rich repeat-containing protein 63 n=1 Tax=Nannospalax galili TaxID=1026970 RepID=UPI0004ED2285|nr:leucine-rich repeat-containing protein 63 [Nannospalax galili]
MSGLGLHASCASTTDAAAESRVKLSEDETTQMKSDRSVSQSRRPISIQSVFLDHNVPERVFSVLSRGHTAHHVDSTIPHSAASSMFIPSCQSASSRVFRKKLSQIRKSKKSKEKGPKGENVFTGKRFGNIFSLSSQFIQPAPSSYSRIIASKYPTASPESHPLPKTPDYTQEGPYLPRDVSGTLISPIPSSTSTVREARWSERPIYNFASLSKVVLNIAKLPEIRSLPTPVLPRKPQRQTALALIRMRRLDPDAHVLRGEGFKTVAATHYETITAMTSLAIIICQIYGRNALSLKGFFLLQCPDLTSVALQLIYLNLSFNHLTQFPTEIFCLKNLQILKLRNNPIKEIPSEIEQLKCLRNFCIAFNLIRDLPVGLFCLPCLEELDISYNEIYVIPNEIQKLRSLDKLNIDGNYMTSFPPGILKLNLTKLQFDNTFTNHNFWAENCLNSPQRLPQLCSLFIVKNNLHKIQAMVPKIFQKFLKSTSRCDWCHGPKFGDGLRIIRSCDMFGATQIPIMFYVCSSSCYLEIRESGFVLEGFPSRRIILNKDWVKEKKASEVSFYL